MQSSFSLSKIKPAIPLDAAEEYAPVMHTAFKDIEKRWGIDCSCIPVNRKAYPQIQEWKADQPYGKSWLSTWNTYFVAS